MNGITEWLANLSPATVAVVIVVLVGLRYALLKLNKPAARSAAEIAESLAIAMGLVFLIIRPFFVQAFFIPSPSMVPTLLVHDHILVNKTVYRMRDPKPGEVAVFKAPIEALEISNPLARLEAKQTDFIKRVIAEPGDEVFVRPGYVLVNGIEWGHEQLRSELSAYDESIRIKSDAVYIGDERVSTVYLAERLGVPPGSVELHPGYVVRNGHRLNESYLAEDPDSPYPDRNDIRTWPSVEKAVSEGRLELIEDGGPLRVKLGQNQYMMMGDNRNNSSDSRFWGPLERKRMVGRAMFIFWPFGRVHWAR